MKSALTQQADATVCRDLHTTWLCAIVIGFILMGCHPHPTPPAQPHQERLINRISRYYDTLQAQAYAKSNLFYADRRPQVPAGRSSLASKLSLKMAAYEIQSMQINEMDARVIMHITVAGHDNHYDIVMIDQWQFIGDNWFVIEAAQPPAEDSIKPLNKKMWQNGIKW